MSQVYIALDTETTGLRPETDGIIEIGAVKFTADGKVLDTWNSFVNPQMPVPAKITRLTGIKPSDVSTAPFLRDVAAKLVSFVQDFPIVGHNIQFDLGFLGQKGIGLPNTRVDTFELASIVLPKMKSYSLEQLTKALEIASPTYHRALADATLAKDLFLALVTRAVDLDVQTVQEINRLAIKADWGLREVFRDVEQQKSRFGLSGSIREQLRAKGELDILGRDVAKEEKLQPTDKKQPLDVEALAAILGEGGLLSHYFPGYEHRPQQIAMLRAVVEVFNYGGHLIAEAGTGVGKSLSYLIPAVYFATANGRRVVVSTNTINLQDQLYNKDIPDLQAILSKANPPRAFNAALVKGRSNYLCLRRWASFRQRGDHSLDEIRLAAKVLVWLPTTLSGERSELTIAVTAENIAWSRISAQSETCSPDTCEYFRRNQCYLYRARRQAESAHIVVVNHALLISDLATENRVLPEYSHLVIDEAHHLEDVATDQLGFSAGQKDVFMLLEELSSGGEGERTASGPRTTPGGFLSTVPAHFMGSHVSPEDQARVQMQIAETHNRLQQTRRSVYEFFNLLSAFLSDRLEENEDGWTAQNKGTKPAYDQPVRLTQGMRNNPAWSQVEIVWENLDKRLAGVDEGLGKLHKALSGLANQKVNDYDALQADVQGFMSRFSSLRNQGTAIISQPERTGIYWLTVAAQGGDVTMHAAPLHVGGILAEQLFGQKESVILTSATMTTEGAFRYMRERLGLEEINELLVGSPFDYKSSALLFVPTDMPEPGKVGYQNALNQTLIALAKATQGRMLVLFTSHSAVRTTYQAISPALESEGIAVLGHAIDGQPRQLVERFKTTPQSVLMGTSSLWEGIDVVGEALSVLVIAKLPFSVPSDPIFAARSESFEDPFSEYAVPQTVLKFKQGFGRLIRSQTDRGVVAVLDRRVVSKSYGKAFLASLPDCTQVKDRPLNDLPKLAKAWLEGERKEPAQKSLF